MFSKGLENRPYFVDQCHLDNPDKRALIEAFQTLEKPSLPASGIPLGEGWRFSTGTPAEGLSVSLSEAPPLDSLTDLPHRLLAPNHPIWYSKEITFDEEGVIFVNADDGAQLFYAQHAITAEEGSFFRVLPSTAPVRVTIRVLNNAMKGGLRDVRFISQYQYLKYLHSTDVYGRAENLLKQLIEQKSFSGEVSAAFLNAIRNPTLQNISKAEALSPGILVLPFLQRTPDGKAVITMETASDSPPPELWWGRSIQNMSKQVETKSEGNIWQFTLPQEADEADSLYYFLSYRGHNGQVTAISTKETIPFAFTAWGDSQGGWRVFRRHILNMQKEAPAFTIGLGDLTSDGVNEQQWRAFFACLQPLAGRVPVVLVPGNHDYDGYYDKLYSQNYHRYAATPNYFCWAYGNAIFLTLDPNTNFPLGIDHKQKKWMEQTMASEAWLKARWRFVLIHQPPYSQGWPGYHGDGFIRNIIDSLAETARIDFVLSGHSHDYERLSKNYGGQQVNFLVLGGAGGGLEPEASSEYPRMDKVVKAHHYGAFEVFENRVVFKAIGLNGNIIDEAVFFKNGED